jgi:hypothetical protein
MMIACIATKPPVCDVRAFFFRLRHCPMLQSDATVAKQLRIRGSETFFKKASNSFLNCLAVYQRAWLMCVYAQTNQHPKQRDA